MIVFISCTAKKKHYQCKAKEMYSESTWFRHAFRYAKYITGGGGNIYILSAKYGLLEPDKIISPYNQTLHAAKVSSIRSWSKTVYRQMIENHINFNDQAMFLCGKNYRRFLMPLFKKASAPLSHMGIGKQVSWLKQHEEDSLTFGRG